MSTIRVNNLVSKVFWHRGKIMIVDFPDEETADAFMRKEDRDLALAAKVIEGCCEILESRT